MFLQVYSLGIYDTKYGLYIVTQQFILAVFACSMGKAQIKKSFSSAESRTKIVEINFNAEKDYQVHISRHYIVLSGH